MWGKCQSRLHTCKEVWYWTLVVYWSRVLRRNGTVWKKTVLKEFGITSRKRCCWNSQESRCPIFRATTPLSRGKLKNKGHGKLSIHFAADQEAIETVFRIFLANQLSLYGAVANICEEFESLHDRSGQADKVMGTISCPRWNQGRSSFGEWQLSIPESSIATIWKNELKGFHKKTEWVNFVLDAGFISVL